MRTCARTSPVGIAEKLSGAEFPIRRYVKAIVGCGRGGPVRRRPDIPQPEYYTNTTQWSDLAGDGGVTFCQPPVGPAKLTCRQRSVAAYAAGPKLFARGFEGLGR